MLTSFSDCGCLPGFEDTFDTGCSECPVDFYREHGDSVCRSCPLNSGTPGAANSAGTACLCKPGFQLEASNCMACLLGTFKSALAMLECSACPGNSISPPSSSAQEDCICHAGFYPDYLSDASCVPCALLGPGARDSAKSTQEQLTASRTPARRHAKTVFVQGGRRRKRSLVYQALTMKLLSLA